MTQPTDTKIKVSELYQVCIVVRDIEKSMENYQDTLGIGSWSLRTIDSSRVSDMTYRGRPVQHVFKVAQAKVGAMDLELIQPVEGDSIYSEFLEQGGEGLHHLGHVKVGGLDAAIQTLENAGFPCLQSGRFPGGGYAYMDTSKTLGTIIELIQRPEKKRDQSSEAAGKT